MKDDHQKDHLEAGMQTPDGTFYRVIPSQFLWTTLPLPSCKYNCLTCIRLQFTSDLVERTFSLDNCDFKNSMKNINPPLNAPNFFDIKDAWHLGKYSLSWAIQGGSAGKGYFF